MMWWVGGLFLLLGLTRLAVTEQRTVPQRGPRQNETHRFRYQSSSQPGLFLYCRYCPKMALDDSTYSYMQVTSCLKNYPYDVVWQDVLTPYEWENKKFPLCNEGETPGCGVPPAITNIDWECEEGYSGENHSVYFPCQGRCNVTTEVHYHAYCNATLQWEITEVITDNKCEVAKQVAEKGDGVFSNEEHEVAIVLGCAAAGFVGLIAVIITICCARKWRKRKKTERRQKQEQNGIPLRVLNPQIGCRPQEHVDLGRFPGHIPNGSAGQAPQNPVQGPTSQEGAQIVNETHIGQNKNVHVHRNNLTPARATRSSNTLPKNTNNVALQTISETPSDYRSDLNTANTTLVESQVGSQVPLTDSSETIRKQVVDCDISRPSYSLSSANQGLETQALDSPQTLSKSFVNNSQTPLGFERSHGVDSIRADEKHLPGSDELSLSCTRSRISADKSNKFQSTSASNSLSMCNADIGINTDNIASADDDSNSDVEADETTKLLSSEDYANETHNEKSSLLQEGTVEGDAKIDSSISNFRREISNDRLLNATGSSVSGSNERLGSDRQPNSLGSSISGSSREPVEHELVTEPDIHVDVEDEDVIMIKEKQKPKIHVITKEELKEDGNKFYVYKDEPFVIAARTKPNGHMELKIMQEGTGIPFLGRSNHHELSHLPIIRVDRATADDEGMFSWSLLSNLETSHGNFEIFVLDKETDERPTDPPGAATRETVMETQGQATSTVQNQLSPPGFLSDAPELDPGSFAEDQRLSGENPGTVDKPSISGLQEEVKGERQNEELREIRFYDLDPLTISDQFGTREGPSGTSTMSATVVSSNNEVLDERPSVHETAKKTVVAVTGPHNCCSNTRKASKALMKVLKKLKVKTFKLLAQQHGIDAVSLHTLLFMEDTECEESELVEALFELLGDRGLRLGHLLDYFYSQNLPDRHIVKDIIQNEHPECSYCFRFYS